MALLHPGKTGQIIRPGLEYCISYLQNMEQQDHTFNKMQLQTVYQLYDYTRWSGDLQQKIRIGPRNGTHTHWYECTGFTVLAEPPDEDYYINQMESYGTI